jgi:DNA helicase-2/ATP-dependent DNA helicase PcrA
MKLNSEEILIIQEEERLFQKTIKSLCEELPHAQKAKVEANIAARDMTRQMTSEWNFEERQPLVSDEAVAHKVFDIRKEKDQALLELIAEPYFGRVVTLEEDNREVEFLIGKKSNIDAGIVDWRNGPIASLFFNYEQGDEFFETINERERVGKIKIRRSFKVEEGTLVQIEASEGLFRRAADGWEKLDVDEQLAAHRSRTIGSKEKKLPNVLSLITKDQYEMITADPDQPVIIQGSAGSGKTTVALHRLAWLLHEGNSYVRPERTKVLMMNKSLQMYVGSTLPSMGIDNVETTTFNGWAMGLIRRAIRGGKVFFKYHNLPAFVEEIKYSEEILDAISAYVEHQSAEADKSIREHFARWKSLLDAWERGKPKAILPRIRDFIHEIKQSKVSEHDQKAGVKFLGNLQGQLENYVQDVYSLLSDKDHLTKYLKPVDKLDSHLDYLHRITAKNRKKGNLDYFDMALILRNIQLKNGGLPGKNSEAFYMDHLVIDEAQDFGPVEYAIMVNAVKDKRHLTIVGDVAQKIFVSRKFIGWDKIIHNLGLEESHLVRLEVSFRCTAPIMTLARKITGDPKPVQGRNGKSPKRKRVEDRNELLESITQWVEDLQREDPNKLIALICRYPKQAMHLKEELEEMIPDGVRLGHRSLFSFEPGVIVTNIHQVKGLEFDSVCIVEPSEENYPHLRSESKNLLYVAVTRAQDDLLLIGEKAFTHLI